MTFSLYHFNTQIQSHWMHPLFHYYFCTSHWILHKTKLITHLLFTTSIFFTFLHINIRKSKGNTKKNSKQNIYTCLVILYHAQKLQRMNIFLSFTHNTNTVQVHKATTQILILFFVVVFSFSFITFSTIH